MKFILKNPKNEPKEVAGKRLTPGSTFDDLPKEPLRVALLKEQSFICAYCMQRIKNDWKSTKIEHWAPRNEANEKDYMNLLAVCKGNEGAPNGEQHCDTSKGNQPITISPLNSNCEQLIRFDPGGHIYSNDPAIDDELKNILKLDLQYLVEERMKLMDFVKNEIQKAAKNSPASKIKKAGLTNMLKDWQTPKKGKFEPFCQVAIAYIQKKLARLP
ncbi:MAG: TIGR02646 family protein [Saprospiraceae bacterium]|nr:MAG: TIGR02646 family protein [Saprospiraceae bacterium]